MEVACEVADKSSFRPNTLWLAAQTIRFKILDAEVLLNVYFDAEKARKASEQELQP